MAGGAPVFDEKSGRKIIYRKVLDDNELRIAIEK